MLKIQIQKKQITSEENLFFLTPIRNKPIQRLLKKIIDYTGAFIGITLLFLFFILAAVAIKIDSRGPVFYKHLRVGKYKKKFYMYKFRSMEINADNKIVELVNKNQSNNIMFKMNNDPRVTRVGRFIRKYSIDEFPQLLNVLKGEMSLVGPRPPLPREVEQYKMRHNLRLGATPGLTGLWQVSGRSNIKCFEKVVDLDIKYLKNWNLMLDLVILVKTIPIVLFGKDFE
jgi:lipopolysaccharide/colanic/teichoic acid biosynthesis glycosyltransferase